MPSERNKSAKLSNGAPEGLRESLRIWSMKSFVSKQLSEKTVLFELAPINRAKSSSTGEFNSRKCGAGGEEERSSSGGELPALLVCESLGENGSQGPKGSVVNGES